MAKGRFQIYLLRHADAGDPEAWHGLDDERPLSSKGERQAERLGRFLAAIGFGPDAVISSPKLRERQPAEIVAGPLGKSVGLDERLGGNFTVSTIAALLGEQDGAARIMLAGRDPDFSEVVAELCRTTAIPMPKGALARVDLANPSATDSATLRWLIPPDALKPAS